MTDLVHHLLTPGVTAGMLIAQLAEMDPDNRLIAPDKGITLSWLRVASLDDEDLEGAADGEDESVRVAAALEVPHLPAIAAELRHLPAAPGRPTVKSTAIALGLDVSRPAADRIARTLAALPWPPDWVPEPVPQLSAGSGR